MSDGADRSLVWLMGRLAVGILDRVVVAGVGERWRQRRYCGVLLWPVCVGSCHGSWT